MVSTSALPTVAILLGADKGEVKLRVTSKAELPILVLLGPPRCLILRLLLPLFRFPSQRRGMTFRLVLQLWKS